MVFERFEARRKRFSPARVRIYKNGKWVFNRKAMELLGGRAFILLYFNKEDRRIGLRPRAGFLDYAWPISIDKNGANYITCLSFLKKHEIRQGPYIASWNSHEQMIILQPERQELSIGEEGTQGGAAASSKT